MKWLYVTLALLLAGCSSFGSSDPRVSVHESLTLMNYAIAAAADGAAFALDMDQISLKDACKVEQYGSLAGVIVDKAWVAVFLGDVESAEGMIASARAALTGVSAEAVALVADHCGGLP